MHERIQIIKPESIEPNTFSTQEFANIFGVTKATVLRWESKNRFSMPVQRVKGKSEFDRQFRDENIIDILRYLQNYRYRNGIGRNRWLEGIDLTGSFEVTTPSGYRIIHIKE